MKHLILGLITVTILTGCSLSNEKENVSSLESSSIVTNEEDVILYTGTVIDGVENNENSLFISNLMPVDSVNVNSFDEVILLMDDVALFDQKTGKNLNVEDIKNGDTVNVILIKNTPITMSLPAQIPGMGIVKVERVN